jgi:hypothetical protein
VFVSPHFIILDSAVEMTYRLSPLAVGMYFEENQVTD